ncbi:MAG: hypothetical protein IJI58_04605 [Bacilli bacterium]|nr:hypothetical protein [Bacilli bacterium]
MKDNDLEGLLELNLMVESPVSIHTLTNRFRESGLREYLRALDDDELSVAYHLIRREAITDETREMLEFIEVEKATRHYSRILEGLKESKTR